MKVLVSSTHNILKNVTLLQQKKKDDDFFRYISLSLISTLLVNVTQVNYLEQVPEVSSNGRPECLSQRETYLHRPHLFLWHFTSYKITWLIEAVTKNPTLNFVKKISVLFSLYQYIIETVFSIDKSFFNIWGTDFTGDIQKLMMYLYSIKFFNQCITTEKQLQQKTWYNTLLL